MPMKALISGTREWACKTVNCVRGCAHDCRYCYAKAMAICFKRKTPLTWSREEQTWNQIQKICRICPTRVMFPSTHDITPASLAVCLQAIDAMLARGHSLLIVSKPHVDCIEKIVTLR